MAHSDQKQSVAIHRIELPTGFDVGTVNTFVLRYEDQCILVDCGPKKPETERALIQGLDEIGLQLSDVTGLFLTHGHVDHVGLASLLQKNGVPIYTHPLLSGWLDPGGHEEQYRIDFYRQLYVSMGMPPEDLEIAIKSFFFLKKLNDRSEVDVPLVPGSIFPPLPMFRVISVPGHAQVAIALWNEENGLFIAGDQLLPHISSNALVEPCPGAEKGSLAKRTNSLIDYRNNLHELQQLPIQIVYPGHGDIFTEAHPLIEQRLREQEKRRERILELLHEYAPISAYQLATILFPKKRREASLILSEVLGFLDWLAADQKIYTKTSKDGTLLWYVH